MNWPTFLIGILLIILSLAPALIVSLSETHIEEVECYDKYGNEILDVTCEEKVYNNEFVQEGIDFFTVMGFFLIVSGVLMILFSFMPSGGRD